MRCELLEQRQMLSGSNAVDELDFGNLTSEAAHNFEPGYSPVSMPTTGVGALGQTYREPFGLGDNAIDGPQAMTLRWPLIPQSRIISPSNCGAAMWMVERSISPIRRSLRLLL